MRVICLLVVVFFLFSCKENKHIERISEIDYSVLSDSIYARMPGELYGLKNYIVWIDPFALENYVHILDASTGRELNSWGKIGDGPEEFSTVGSSLAYPPYLLLFDLNKKIQALVNIDSLALGKEVGNVHWIHKDLNGATSYLQLDENIFLSFYPEKSIPFEINTETTVESSGKAPFSDKLENGFSVFQGTLAYNIDKKNLVYSTFEFPYTTMYHFENGTLQQEWENKANIDYTINDGNLVLPKDIVKGFHSMALSKDYIIGVQRDKEVEGKVPAAREIRDTNQLSRSLFIYDYNFELLKIINLEFPVLRITTVPNTNEVLAIVVNPEYQLIKFSLD